MQHLLMGRDRLKVAEVARLTGLNRSSISALYNDQAKRIDVDSINQLCQLFNCKSISELLEYIPEDD